MAGGLQVLLPALGKERIEVGTRVQARMHIAVDDSQAALGGSFLFKHRAVDDVAHAILLLKVYAARLSRGKVSSGLSAHMRDTILAGRCGGIRRAPPDFHRQPSGANRNLLSANFTTTMS